DAGDLRAARRRAVVNEDIEDLFGGGGITDVAGHVLGGDEESAGAARRREVRRVVQIDVAPGLPAAGRELVGAVERGGHGLGDEQVKVRVEGTAVVNVGVEANDGVGLGVAPELGDGVGGNVIAEAGGVAGNAGVARGVEAVARDGGEAEVHRWRRDVE